MFIAALFIIIKTRKQTKCPSTDYWLKKKWYKCAYTCIYVYVCVYVYICIYTYIVDILGFLSGSAVKNPPAMQEPQETQVHILGGEDPLEEGMATHSSILALRIPWTEEPGKLQSIVLQSRVQLKQHSTHADIMDIYMNISQPYIAISTTWMDLKNIRFSTISQRKTKTIYYHLYVISEK